MPAFSAHMLDPGIAALPRDIEATRGTVAVVSLAVRGDATDAASERSLAVLRDDLVPATVGRLPGVETARH